MYNYPCVWGCILLALPISAIFCFPVHQPSWPPRLHFAQRLSLLGPFLCLNVWMYRLVEGPCQKGWWGRGRMLSCKTMRNTLPSETLKIVKLIALVVWPKSKWKWTMHGSNGVWTKLAFKLYEWYVVPFKLKCLVKLCLACCNCLWKCISHFFSLRGNDALYTWKMF